jgi:SAM-dependent methyltransferase
MKTDSAPNLDRTSDVLQHNKQREAEAVSRKSTAGEGKSEGEWLLKLPFAGRGMSNIRLCTGEMFNFAVSVMALDPAPGDLVLDLGAGSCWVSEWLNRLLVDTVSLDYAHDMLAIGRQRLEPGAKLTAGDFEKLPFTDSTFDGAICLSALHHVPDIPTALREIRRVLKPNGVVVFSEPGTGHSAQPQSHAEMVELGVLERDIVVDELLDACLAAGFTSVEVQPYLLPPPTYTREMWYSIQGAFASADTPRGGVRQAISLALSFGREAWTWLGRKMPGLRRPSHSSQPSVLSALALSWQSLSLFRNAVRAHPLVIARRAQRIPDSRRPSVLDAKIVVSDAPGQAPCGATLTIHARVRNTGDTLWLHKPSELGGYVAVGAKLVDREGLALIYDYGRAILPSDVAPGEEVSVGITVVAPTVPGRYQVKLDMVDELVVWFEHRGSRPVLLPFEAYRANP